MTKRIKSLPPVSPEKSPLLLPLPLSHPMLFMYVSIKKQILHILVYITYVKTKDTRSAALGALRFLGSGEAGVCHKIQSEVHER